MTSWQNQTEFGGKVVPRHFVVQGGTRDLLTADVTVESAGTVDPAAFQLPGEPADPGMTLRPMHGYDANISIPNMTYSFTSGDGRSFTGIIREVLDRHGVAREVEVIDSQNPAAAEAVLVLIRGDRFHPAEIDKSPCGLPCGNHFENPQNISSKAPRHPWPEKEEQHDAAQIVGTLCSRLQPRKRRIRPNTASASHNT